jgi:hypothetical protein
MPFVLLSVGWVRAARRVQVEIDASDSETGGLDYNNAVLRRFGWLLRLSCGAAWYLAFDPRQEPFAVQANNTATAEDRHSRVFAGPAADCFDVDTDNLRGFLDRDEERRRNVVRRRSMGAHQKEAPESAFGNVNPPLGGPEGPPI